ncbi:MAG: NAD-dependent epimerase/dehydratase family protein [Kofleriaceae bacterium]
MTPLIVVGCGYVGSRIARAALAEGRTVRVCARGTGKLAPLQELGAEVKYLDVSVPKQLPVALASLQGCTVVYSVPPVSNLPPGKAIAAVLQAAYGAGAANFILFSSSGLYGANPDDDVWVDEDTPIAHDDPAMKNVVSDEDEIQRSTFERMKMVTLRLAPVYGAGRGVRHRLLKGDYKLLDDGSHAISRIHIDDVVQTVFAAETERAPHKSLYLVADDEPTTQREYATWLCERLKLPLPPSRSQYDGGAARVAHRNRKIRNAKLHTLVEKLKYPTFREGEAQIESEL